MSRGAAFGLVAGLVRASTCSWWGVFFFSFFLPFLPFFFFGIA